VEVVVAVKLVLVILQAVVEERFYIQQEAMYLVQKLSLLELEAQQMAIHLLEEMVALVFLTQ
jgi:hypothetical protein